MHGSAKKLHLSPEPALRIVHAGAHQAVKGAVSYTHLDVYKRQGGG